MNLSGNDINDTSEGDLLTIKKKQREWSSPSIQQSEKVRQTREAFEKLHQQTDDDDDLYDFGKVNETSDTTAGGAVRQFTPPPAPISIGTQQKIGTEQQQIMASKIQNSQMGYQTAQRPSLSGSAYPLTGNDDTTPLTPIIPQGTKFSPLMPPSKEGFALPYLGASSTPHRGNNIQDTDLYKIHGGHHTPVWQPHTMSSAPDDLLLKKLNYMIHLLEEQKDDKTGNATEEILLYSFLGVFMIFLVDSFTRAGKYVR